MKFGPVLEAQRNPAFDQGYIDYRFLKARLKDVASAAETGSASTVDRIVKEFALQLEEELAKVQGFTRAKIDEFRASLAVLKRRSAGANSSNVAALFADTDRLAELLVGLEAFARLNRGAFSKLVTKLDQATNLNNGQWFSARLSASTFNNIRFDAFVLGLSGIYARLRAVTAALTAAATAAAAAEGGATASAADDDGGSNPADGVIFERSTSKFWLRLEDVLKLKCMLLRQLPVLIFKDREMEAVDSRDEESDLGFGGAGKDAGGSAEGSAAAGGGGSDSAIVTSVYCDCPAFTCYTQRLARENGARLFRARWYGSAIHPPPKQQCWIERKTHHEKWTQESSLKERFSIRAKDVAPFLSGALTSEAYAAAVDRRVADGDMSAAAGEKVKTLAAEISEEVVSRGLAPVVRTRYRRTAFQEQGNAKVRISLDTELGLYSERLFNTFGSPPSGPTNATGNMDTGPTVMQFPFAVVEVKLADASNPPEWLATVLATGLLTPCKKSSKYLTAVYHVFGRSPSRPLERPHWFRESDRKLQVVSTYRAAARKALEAAKLNTPLLPPSAAGASGAEVKGGGEDDDEPDDSVRLEGLASQLYYSRVMKLPSSSSSKPGASGGAGTGRQPSQLLPNPLSSKRLKAATVAPASDADPSGAADSDRSSARPYDPSKGTAALSPLAAAMLAVTGRPDGVVPPGSTANFSENRSLLAGSGSGIVARATACLRSLVSKRTLRPGDNTNTNGTGEGTQGSVSASSATSAAAAAGFNTRPGTSAGRATDSPPWQVYKSFFLDCVGLYVPPQSAGRMPPARVDPKTLFGNERLFLKWLSVIVILVAVAVSLGSTSSTARFLGPVAICFLIWTAFRFYFRAFLVKISAPYGYHDKWGPAIFVFIVVIAVISNLSQAYNKTGQTVIVTNGTITIEATSTARRLVSSTKLADSEASMEDYQGLRRASSLPRFTNALGLASDSASNRLLLAGNLQLTTLALQGPGARAGGGNEEEAWWRREVGPAGLVDVVSLVDSEGSLLALTHDETSGSRLSLWKRGDEGSGAVLLDGLSLSFLRPPLPVRSIELLPFKGSKTILQQASSCPEVLGSRVSLGQRREGGALLFAATDREVGIAEFWRLGDELSLKPVASLRVAELQQMLPVRSSSPATAVSSALVNAPVIGDIAIWRKGPQDGGSASEAEFAAIFILFPREAVVRAFSLPCWHSLAVYQLPTPGPSFSWWRGMTVGTDIGMSIDNRNTNGSATSPHIAAKDTTAAAGEKTLQGLSLLLIPEHSEETTTFDGSVYLFDVPTPQQASPWR